MNHLSDKVGCKPPYWYRNTSELTCSNMTQMKKAHDPFRYYTWTEYLNEVLEPCQDIETLGLTYSEDIYDHVYSNGTSKEKVFDVILRFRDMPRFKEIRHVMAYDFQSAYGNAGGYIGVYVGWSFLQIPELIMYIYRKTKRIY